MFLGRIHVFTSISKQNFLYFIDFYKIYRLYLYFCEDSFFFDFILKHRTHLFCQNWINLTANIYSEKFVLNFLIYIYLYISIGNSFTYTKNIFIYFYLFLFIFIYFYLFLFIFI